MESKKKKLYVYICTSFVSTLRKFICSSFKIWGAFTMRYHPISKDLKAWIPVLQRQGYNVKKICYLLGLKKSSVYHSLAHFHCHGVPYNRHAHRPFGRRRVLLPEDLKLIVALLKQRHCIYLDELQAEIYNIHGVTLSQSSITRTLHHLQYSHKHVSTRALERNNLMRSAFMNKIADQVPNPDMLILLMRPHAIGEPQHGLKGGRWLEGDVCRGDTLFVDKDFLSSRSSHWMGLSHMISFQDLWTQSVSWNFFAS